MSNRIKSTALALLASTLLIVPPSAMAANPVHGWRGASTTGTVDSSSTDHVWHLGSMTTIQYASPSDSKVVLRFDINPDKIFFPDIYSLQARVYDAGSGERVVVRLRELDYRTGAIRTRMSLNSDDFDPIGWQSISKTKGRPAGFSISDEDKCYYIEVELKKNSSSGLPIVMGLSINGCLI